MTTGAVVERTVLADASARVQGGITRKRAGEELSADDIEATVADFVQGRIAGFQMSAWLATVACRGMTTAEVVALTRAYMSGGTTLDLSGLGRPVVDKHSTGGVGDKVTLVVVPTVAACGVAVAKMSGRGLGYAGGTIDKLESIDGLRLELSPAEARAVLDDVGMVITGQSEGLAPGDGATYALRDVTATVDCIPLIAASIVSKKVAVGADGLVLDVKTGAGALIADFEGARQLATLMVDLATSFGLRCVAVLSDMSQPLGHAVGNALEVKEAVTVLRGQYVPGVSELCRHESALLLQAADHTLGDEEAAARVDHALSSGAAYDKFVRWVRAQGGDEGQVVDPDLLPAASRREVVTADRAGWVTEVDPRAVGEAAVRLGAGRLVPGAPLDYGAGLVVNARVGDRVEAGDPLVEVHHGDDADAARSVALARSAFRIGDDAVPPPEVVHDVLTPALGVGR